MVRCRRPLIFLAPVVPRATTARRGHVNTACTSHAVYIHMRARDTRLQYADPTAGDKTFLIAAIMATRHARSTVFAGAFASLVLMSILSAALGRIILGLIPKVSVSAISVLSVSARSSSCPSRLLRGSADVAGQPRLSSACRPEMSCRPPAGCPWWCPLPAGWFSVGTGCHVLPRVDRTTFVF